MAPRKQTKSPGGTSVPKKKVAANGFKLPDHIPFGTVVTDIAKKSWIIGPSIGQGGFGEIYLASNNVSRPVPPTAEYVVKIEPHTNGPLFTEMHCYMRIGRPSLIDDWMTSHKLHKLGMPQYLGSGSFDHVTGNKSCVKYRFMVMERFGSDLQKILDKHNKKFSFKTAYQVGLDIIDALEYIHAQGYIHADIKASNLLIGYKKGTENQVFLVDYGLACRYSVAGVHKEYKYDGRRAHDGTIEFTSRDAHIGAHSRRGDLEILGYNLLQWLAGSLPWEDCLTDCDAVAKMKRHYMDNIPALLDKCFPDYAPQPPGLAEYLVYVSTLTFDEEPDYSRCRSILRAGLIARGHQDDNKLVFAPATPAAKIPGKRGQKRARDEQENSSSGQQRAFDFSRMGRTSPRAPCKSSTNRINTRLCPRQSYVEISLSTVTLPTARMITDPEDIIIEKEVEKMRARQQRPRRSLSGQHGPGTGRNRTSTDPTPTPAMLSVMARMRERNNSPPLCAKRHRHNSTCVTGNTETLEELTPCDLTPAMVEVIQRRNAADACRFPPVTAVQGFLPITVSPTPHESPSLPQQHDSTRKSSPQQQKRKSLPQNNRKSSGSRRLSSKTAAKLSATNSNKSPANSNKSQTMANKAPNMANKAPNMANKSPNVANKSPNMTNKVPTMLNKVPTMSNKVPTMSNKVPTMSNKVQTMTTKAPTVNNHVPTMTTKSQPQKSLRKSARLSNLGAFSSHRPE